jgi:hypothetical protein
MRLLRVLGAVPTLLLAAPLAHADDEPRPVPEPYGGTVRAAPEPYVAEPAPPGPPLGRRGFQLALRSGASLPFGDAKEPYAGEATLDEHASSSMRDLTGLQVPLTLDLGGKPDPHLFIGGTIGLAVGWPAGRLADACDRLPLDCRSTTVRLGALIEYVIAPHAWVTPWVGYGIGYSWFAAGDGQRQASLRGFEIAHFLLGLDVRLSRTFGIGPYVDYAIGSFSRESLSAGTSAAIDRGIGDEAWHHWLTIGPRLLLYP